MEIERKREAITPTQMNEIYREVHTYHDYVLKGRGIKYIDVCYDNRTCSIFYIQFRNSSTKDGDRVFTCTNRFEEEDVYLYDEVMKWLVDGRDKQI